MRDRRPARLPGVRYPEPFANYATFAIANGAPGIKVDHPGDLRSAIGEALAHPGPAIVDVNVNPDEPPLPGRVEYQQVRKFAQAFLKGQPRRAATRDHPVQRRDRAAQVLYLPGPSSLTSPAPNC